MEVYCSRYINEHMVAHNVNTGHEMAISSADLSVWCYSCDYYVDNDKLYAAKNALH
jgi:histone deacetylase 6